MYGNFEEELLLTEEQIRRRHNQRQFLRRNAQLLQQELELEDELIEENPELAQVIHDINTLETQAHHQAGLFHSLRDLNLQAYQLKKSGR